MHLTDNENGKQLSRIARDELIYSEGHWLQWDGQVWGNNVDVTDLVDRVSDYWSDMARRVAITKPELKSAIMRHASSVGNEPHRSAMLKLAQPKLYTPVEDLDSDPEMLNCHNGVINLNTGDIYPHAPLLHCTRYTTAGYSSDTPHRWLSFLDDIFSGDQKTVDFAQRALGYTISGHTTEQCLFVLHGEGANGKTTFVEVVKRILGTYANTIESTSLLTHRPGTIRSDIACLRGSRMVSAVEIGFGNRQLDESTLKKMTGKDTMKARFLYGGEFEFIPSWKLWISTNHRPEFQGEDDGTWRRIVLIPFSIQFKGNRRIGDMDSILLSEKDAILGWMVQGFQLWKKHGLCPPEIVTNATKSYRDESNIIQQFRVDRLVVSPPAKVTRRDIYLAYRSWATQNSDTTMEQKSFMYLLRKTLPFEDAKIHGIRYCKGIGLRKLHTQFTNLSDD